MKKKFILGIILLLTIIAIPTYAVEKADNGFFADEDVKVDKDINTSSFAAGNTVLVESHIDGLSFAAGNNVTIKSTQDHLFVAGNNIMLEGAATKDAFIAGNVITVSASEIRDLYVAGQTVRIDSNIGRNVYIGGETVTINSTIEGNVKIAAKDIRIGKEANIKGTLMVPEESNVSISESATVEKQKTYIGVQKVDKKITVMSIVVSHVMNFLSLLLVGVLFLALRKRFFQSLKEEEKEPTNLFKHLAIGLAVLVGVPFAALLLMVTLIGMPISLIAIAMYCILIYLSTIASAYYVGSWVMKEKEVNETILLIGSLFVLYIAKVLPVVGGFISLVSLLLGLGIYAKYMFQNGKEEK